MPNWCFNTLTITSRQDDPEGTSQLADFRTRLEAGVDPANPKGPRLHLLDTFVSMPTKYVDTVKGSPRVAADDGLTWWDWQVANWGVKWGDVRGRILVDGSDAMILRFDTAWAPPTQALVTISAAFPELVFRIEWIDEEGSVGYDVVENGRVLSGLGPMRSVARWLAGVGRHRRPTTTTESAR